jgi:ubiquinone/menaquinone biosynthesis C-methylase UbiE
MSEKGSYSIKKIAGGLDIELARLQAQVELFWNKEQKRYIECGLSDGTKIAELGSGPGFLMEKILNQFPNVNVTAVEIDPILVEYSKDYLSRYDQCVVIQGSIMATGLTENSFDFVIARLVLEHLPNPVVAVREVFRILKPGGKAVFIDNDFDMHIMTYPNIVELRELYQAYCKARIAEGGNPTIGRELPDVIKKGGFSKVDFDIISAHSAILGDKLFLESEGLGIPFQLVKKGFLSSSVLGKISVAWRNMLKHENHFILRQLCMAVGEKSC